MLLCYSSYSNADTAPDGTEYIQNSVDYSFGSQNWDPPDSVTELTIGDDQRASVPLDFSFPLGQRLYTQSWMHSNGVVTFMSTFNWMCCNGLDLENYNYNGTAEPYFNHMIAPLWTDTINTNVDIDGDGVDDSGHYTESYEYDDGTKSQRYFWRNVAEYGTHRGNNPALNSFGLEIYDTGKTDIWHFDIDIRNHDIFVGAVQDFQNDDDPVKSILFHDKSTDGAYTFSANNATEALRYSQTPFATYPAECVTNPTYSASCPGYAEALFQQECAADPLYDSSCPGYATAYYNQQCAANALYDPGCPGYATAYYNQQCTADPLYDTGCPGYEQAYLNKQCEEDPLYSVSCSGYAAALAEQEATEEQAPEVVYVEEDYTEPQIIEDPVVNQVVFDEPEVEVIPEPEPEVFVSTVPELDVAVLIEEPIQEPTIEEQIEAEIEPQPEPEPVEEEIEVTFNFSVEEEPEEEIVEEPVIEEEVDEEEEQTESSSDVDEQVDNEGDEESGESVQSDDGETESDTEGKDEPGKPAPKESTKKEKVKKLLAKKAADLAEKLAVAQTLEQQQAIQNEIFALTNFNYEFKGYSVGLGYDTFVIPDNTKSPASVNQRGLRNGLAQELLHNQMVEMQWKR